MAYPGAILSTQPPPLHLGRRQGSKHGQRAPPPPDSAHLHREQSRTSLSPREVEVNRSVGLTKDPGSWGRGVTLGCGLTQREVG